MTDSGKPPSVQDNKAFTIKLGQETHIVSGAPFKSDYFNEAGEGLPLIRVRDVNTGPAGVFYSGEFSKEHLVKNGDLLISMDGEFKVVRWTHGEGLLNQRVCKIISNSTVLNSDYLEHFLPNALSSIHRETTFTTVKHLSTKAIREIVTPLLPLDDQIRIAHVLGKVQRLIAQRKQHLQQLDDLLKSVFLNMFGDPARNEKGWEKKTATDYAECIVPGRDKPKSFSGTTPWVTTGDLQHLGYTSKSRGEIGLSDEEIKQVRARIVPRSSVLLTCVGDLGVVSICIADMVINQQLHAFQVSEVMTEEFFMYSLSFQKKYMYQNASQTTLPYMNKTICNRVPMIRPPKDLQDKFAKTVRLVQRVKGRYQQSLTDLEALYSSLSQRAFKGELDLSQVPLPAAPFEGESPVADAAPAPIATPVIDLPESDLLLPALQDRTQLAPLLRFWLDAYRTQLGRAPFSLERFIATAQTRLVESHPDKEFKWTARDFESIKALVFEALAAGALSQAFDDDGNRIELKAVSEPSLT